MKHAFQLASASVAALFAVSANAGYVKTFGIDFNSYTTNAAPSSSTETAGTWTAGTGDESIVEVKSGADRNLAIDASSTSPLTFTPSTNLATTVSMDVQFVGASTAQTPVVGSKAGIYLDKTSGKLYASVNGGAFGSTDIAVSEGTWYNVVLSFNSNGTVTITVSQDGSQVGPPWTSVATVASPNVSAIDFYGSGKVDNFVGKYSLASATDGDTGVEGDSSSETEMTIENGILTTQFDSNLSGTGDLKFIKVTGTINGVTATRTLRVVNNQNINIAEAGFTSIAKVVAYYGNNVSATNGVTVTTTPAVADSTGAATGTVAAKSGLYYAVERVEIANGTTTTTKSPLNGNAPVAPEAEGKAAGTLPYSVNPSSTGYGVVKFKIVASDDPVPSN